MDRTIILSPKQFKVSELNSILELGTKLEIGSELKKKITSCREFLEKKLKVQGAKYYGINTGFGALCNVSIKDSDIEQLQENLIMSHACGTGNEIIEPVVKLMIFLKIRSLSFGHSGITLEIIQRLVDFFNLNIFPIVLEEGSLGASGDLVPLSHLSLPLIGLGKVYYKGNKVPSDVALKKENLNPLKLKAKEGLALINGTQFMSAWGCYCILEAKRIADLADLVAAVSIDAFRGQIEPFTHLIHQIRPYPGQIKSAKNIVKFLENSEIIKKSKEATQDPYSFRCIPQVHGATRGVIDHVEGVLNIEINSVTDNPLIFQKEDCILSGGNFHGQPLAMALDYLAIAMSEISNISERRTFQLLSGTRDLPPFLIKDSGLNSGLMIPQYTAASLVSMNKQLCSPASVDSITSSNGQEDHVSMGANAATKCYRVIQNVEKVLAIEFLTAAQALDFRAPQKSSPLIETIIKNYRNLVPTLENDRVLFGDIQLTISFLKGLEL